MNTRLLLLLVCGCMAMPPSLTGCAAADAPKEAAPTVVVSATLRAAQRGHGAMAAFALCEAPDCPLPTPKAFAASVSAPPQAREAPDQPFVAPVPERPP